MSDGHLILKIQTAAPVDLSEFVGTFVGLGNQFERFYGAEHPDTNTARFYVREVRAGSIIAELVPYLPEAAPAFALAMAGVKHANDLVKFIENFGGRLSKYFHTGDRDRAAGKGDLSDYLKVVQSVAHDASGSLSLTAYDDGQKRVQFEFSTSEARIAERQIEEHRAELDRTTAADHERVLMIFVKTDKRSAKPGRRSGEAVVISTLSSKALPIVYASDLAEQRIKHEIADGSDNIYKRGFDVDVNVELRNGAPIAYRIVAVHSVIDLPDD